MGWEEDLMRVQFPPGKQGPFESDSAWALRRSKEQAASSGGSGMTADQYYNLAMAEQNAKRAQEQARIDDLKKQGLNPDGSPIALTYNGLTGADGNLKSQYQLSPWQTVKADTSALEKFKTDALRDPGQLSKASQLALDKQSQDQAMSADNAAQLQSNGLMESLNRMAQTGGLSGGARERLSSQSAIQGALERQKVNRQGVMDRLGIMQSDEANRMSGLKDLQGMNNLQADMGFKNQQASNDVNKTNVGNLITDNQNKNSFDMNQYSEQMKKWAAAKSADAQKAAASGGGGGLFSQIFG